MPPIPTPAQLATQAQTKLAHARHAHARGDRPPRAPRPPVEHRACAAALRHHARRRLHRRRANFPDEPAMIDELGTLSFREVDERTNALAHALAADGIEAGDGVAIMCRNHRGWIDAVLACSKLGANALFLNTAFSGPQLTDVAKREKPKAVIYDQEFAEVLKDASTPPQALRRLARPRASQGPERWRTLIARGDTPSPAPPDAAGPRDHPHLGHDRHAEGRLPLDAEVDRPDRRAAVGDPAARAREDDDRRAAVSRVGLRAVGARHQPRDDRRAQAQVRRGGDAHRSPRSTSATRSSSCR